MITELNVDQLQTLQAGLKTEILIIKFGAEWCGPCKLIAPAYAAFHSKCPRNIICADIDVDDNMDLYMALKKQKMVKGIPVFLAFFGGVKRDFWFIPDDSVVGADSAEVAKFFDRCLKKAATLLPNALIDGGYTYYS
jgi:thiol-disulfide isomerase/thioredoxin